MKNLFEWLRTTWLGLRIWPRYVMKEGANGFTVCYRVIKVTDTIISIKDSPVSASAIHVDDKTVIYHIDPESWVVH
jgi:hypothetical protein